MGNFISFSIAIFRNKRLIDYSLVIKPGHGRSTIFRLPKELVRPKLPPGCYCSSQPCDKLPDTWYINMMIIFIPMNILYICILYIYILYMHMRLSRLIPWHILHVWSARQVDGCAFITGWGARVDSTRSSRRFRRFFWGTWEHHLFPWENMENNAFEHRS